MSRTYQAAGGTQFIHNGDYSGEVTITVTAEPFFIGLGKWRIEVPFTDLRELVFAHLRQQKIDQLEQTSDDEFEASLLSLPLVAASSSTGTENES